MSYQDTLSYLFGLQKIGIKMGLSNMEKLVDILHISGNIPKTIHIAGTNGKGSVAATISSILREAGYRVGLYTSPHLVNFTERIMINGIEINEGEVVTLTERIGEAVGRSGNASQLDKITFFEFTTAMAILYFAENNVDVAVMETGMGGRLDATNIISPMVTIITNISLEHKEYLGDTIEAIAYEKAGILKHGVPLISGIDDPSSLKVITERCEEKGSRLFLAGRDFSFERTGKDSFSYRGIRWSLDDLQLRLKGGHQFGNASLALAALEEISDSFNLPQESVREGMEKVLWPGRLEQISDIPAIILDGAHNPAGAQVLARYIETELECEKLYLILGIMADKEIDGIMAPIVPLCDEVIVSRPMYERAASAAALLPRARKYNDNCVSFEELRSAIDYAKNKAGNRDAIIISGSLFTIGEARSILLNPGSL